MKILIFVFKFLNNQLSTQFTDWFKPIADTYSINTRSSANHNLIIPRARTINYGIKSIKFHGAKLWNDLPLTYKTLTDFNSFLTKVKSLLTT